MVFRVIGSDGSTEQINEDFPLYHRDELYYYDSSGTNIPDDGRIHISSGRMPLLQLLEGSAFIDSVVYENESSYTGVRVIFLTWPVRFYILTTPDGSVTKGYGLRIRDVEGGLLVNSPETPLSSLRSFFINDSYNYLDNPSPVFKSITRGANDQVTGYLSDDIIMEKLETDITLSSDTGLLTSALSGAVDIFIAGGTGYSYNIYPWIESNRKVSFYPRHPGEGYTLPLKYNLYTWQVIAYLTEVRV